MRWLLPRVLLERVSYRLILVAALLGVASAVANVGTAALVHATLAHRLETTQARLGLLVAVAVQAIASYASQALMVRAAVTTISSLRLEISRKILQLPLQQLESLGGPEVLGVLIGDVQGLRATVFTMQGALVSLCTLVGCFGYLIWLSLPATLILLAVAATGWIVAMRFQARGERLHFAARAEESTLFGHLASLVQGAKELKLNASHAEEFLREDVAPTARQIADLQIGSQLSWIRQQLTSQLAFMVALAVLLVGPRWTDNAPTQTAFVVTLLFMAAPTALLATWFPEIAKANVFFRKIEALGVQMKTNGVATGPVALPIDERIELVGVSHRYRADTESGDRAFVLGPLNLSVRRGEILFIVGGNGSGKSTLAKILSGLYWPESGSLHVDGRPVDEAQQGAYCANFSAIFSDFHIFERLFDPDAERIEQAQGYLRRLGIHHRVRIEGTRMVTSGLSAGQRKRLALVRGYLENRAVYVFDEWAADQDPSWKELFYLELLPELRRRHKAVVVISHDDRYFDVADRTVKLEEGQIIPASTSARSSPSG